SQTETEESTQDHQNGNEGATTQSFPGGLPKFTWLRDMDGDGYGNNNDPKESATQPPGYVAIGGDCNDNDPALHPNTRWYRDSDGDGYGNPSDMKTQCLRPSGYVLNNKDCNDTDANVNPE